MKKKISRFFSSKKNDVQFNEIDQEKIPQHIAIIMDGNGRWAKKRGLPRVIGHRAGMKTIKNITRLASDIGVKVLTMYAFSTENWSRPKDEVDYIMQLPQEFLAIELRELKENNVQIKMVGVREGLPQSTIQAIDEGIKETASNTGLILNFALNYGSRHELVEMVKKIADDVKEDRLKLEQINEQVISQQLLTADLPDPDLLIRTSGEIRLSNFLLWQLAYTEFWFTDVLWPDFSEKDFLKAIQDFQNRSRRFGTVTT